MILRVIQSFRGDLSHLLGSVKNEKTDVLRRKFGTLAVKRLLRGSWDPFDVFLLTLLFHIFFFCIVNWCGNYNHLEI